MAKGNNQNSSLDLSTFAKNIADNPFGEALNLATNVSTAGAAGFDPTTGKFGEGFQSHLGDESLGEVTGRNLARDAQSQEEQRLQAADAAQAQQRLDIIGKNRQDDITASMSAKGIRASAKAQSDAALSSFSMAANSDEKNFLGL